MSKLGGLQTRKQPPSSAAPEVAQNGKAERATGLPLFLQRLPDGVTDLRFGQRPEELSDDDEPGHVQTKLLVNRPGDDFEREADEVADRAAGLSSDFAEDEPGPQALQRKPVTSFATPSLPSGGLRPPPGGNRLSASVRARVEPVLGADLSEVEVHGDPSSRRAADALGAKAFTSRNHIWLGPNESAEDVELMAHEATHVAQQTRTAGSGDRIVRRQTATEIRDRFTNLLGLNLQEEELGAYLAGLTLGGSYALVIEVIQLLDSVDRDDVAGAMMDSFSARELIALARRPGAVPLLRLMKDEIGDWWGYTTGGERTQANLLGAVLNDPNERELWNRERIEAIKSEAGTDLEVLAVMFEDDLVIDDGSVATRLQAVLGATGHIAIAGLQTGIEFSDTGFAGDQQPGGAGFRDPHPSSRNQPGHFLTAVGLQFSPGTVSQPIPNWDFLCDVIQAPPELRRRNSIRALLGNTGALSDADLALRLTIGHEKAPDPGGSVAALNILITGVIEDFGPAPEGETEEEHDRRVDAAIAAETLRQLNGIINAFRAQFTACTDADVQAWNDALAAAGTGDTLNMAAAEHALRRVSIGFAGRGNSIQDLRLSMVGWRLGQLISSGAFATGAQVAAWIRANLGAPAPAAAAPATVAPTSASTAQPAAPVQPKLKINQPGDIFEQEADAVAELARRPDARPDAQQVSAVSTDQELVQRKTSDVPLGDVPIHDGEAVRPPDTGSALNDKIRSRVEPVLGRDLSSVRVHDSAAARRTAESLEARAFTNRDHIWLGRNQRSDDVELMAHEAAHVVQQSSAPGLIQRREEDTSSCESSEAPDTADAAGQTFGFSQDEMEARLSSTPPGGADATGPTVEVEASTQSTLNEVESEAEEDGVVAEDAGRGGEDGGGTGEGAGRRGREEGRGPRREARGRGEPLPVRETPGPATEFEGLVSQDVAAYLEGNLSDERLAQLGPCTQGLLAAADLLGGHSITDPEAAQLQGLGKGLEPGAPPNLYAGEPLWLRTVAGIRDVTGTLGGIVGVIGLIATVSGFILSLLMPPVGAFLLTVGRFCDMAALILDVVSFACGVFLTGSNRYRLKNETNPEERRRLLAMVRQDAMGTVMSAISVATAIAPGASRLLGRGARRASAGVRAASRSSSVLGRGARALRVASVAGRRALRAGRRGLRAAGQSAAGGFRRLSRSSSLLGRAARGVRVAAVSGRLTMRAAGRAVRRRATQALGWARGTLPVRWANRLGGQAEEWTRRRFRNLAATDTAIGRFFNRRIRGYHERNVMIARSINDPIERAYQERLGRELINELNNLRQANPGWTVQQLDDALRARFGRERYGHAQVGTTESGRIQFVRDDRDFLREVRETEFTEIQLIRDRHPNATPMELENLVNQSPFIKGRWTPEELTAFTNMHSRRDWTGNLNLRDAAGDALAVSKTGHHTVPTGMAPQISQDPRFIQIVNDSRSYRQFIDDAYGTMRHVPEVSSYQIPRRRGSGTRAATSRREVIGHMLDTNQIPGYTRTDLDYFFSRELADDLVADGSTGVWRNRRAQGQTMFFNPHLGIGHEWNWRSNVARQVFDMDSRLGLSLRRELGDQVIEPAIRRSSHVATMLLGGAGSRLESRMDQRTEALVDRAIQSRAAARRSQSPSEQLPPLFEPLPMEPISNDASFDGAAQQSRPAPQLGRQMLPELEMTQPAEDMGTDIMENAVGTREGANLPLFMGGSAGAVDRLGGGGTAGREGPAVPPTPVLYSPEGLMSVREQRIAIAEAIGILSQYIADTFAAEEHNRVAQDAAGSLKDRNAEQSQFAQGERDAVAGEQDKLTQAGSAQEDMAAEQERTSAESDRGKSEADTVQAEGQNVSVEPKPEEPESKSWLERAWDATAGALWDNLIAPAVRAVRRKVNEVMQSINEFITNMINQALGLDEIEAELNSGGEDIRNRSTSLGETDAGLQETHDQAAEQMERNQQTMDQADVNIADTQVMREDAQTLLSALMAHDALLQSEEETGTGYIVDYGSTYAPFFAAEAAMGEMAPESPESMPPEEAGTETLAASEMPMMSEMPTPSEPAMEGEAVSDTAV
jgi:hypothetical protein